MLLGMLAYAVHRKVADYPEARIGGLEEQRSGGVLIGFVPTTNDKDKPWGDCAFKQAL